MSANVYAYCRISTFKPGSASLDAQEAEIKAVAEKLGWQIRGIDKEVLSGYSQESDRLKLYLKRRNAKILIYAVDRFSRNYETGKALAEKLLKCKHELFFVREKLSVKEVGSPKWNIFMKYLEIAEMESKMISERTMSAKKYLKMQGYFTESKAPFGYKKRKLTNGRSKLEVDPYADSVLKFIEDCKTEGISVRKLNDSLRNCDVDMSGDVIVLEDGKKTLETGLRYENIAELLNDYDVNGGPYSANKVARIYKGNCRCTFVL
jgi:DNA invertase Pin-like site-specific DNA recombinase